jgi:hypothetical protein
VEEPEDRGWGTSAPADARDADAWPSTTIAWPSTTISHDSHPDAPPPKEEEEEEEEEEEAQESSRRERYSSKSWRVSALRSSWHVSNICSALASRCSVSCTLLSNSLTAFACVCVCVRVCVCVCV